MGHEYRGIVVEVGADVMTVKPGQFVVGSFATSDNVCPHCRHGFHSSCEQREFMSGAQAPYARVPNADGTLVATGEVPADDLIASLLATSDVLGTGWYAADAARVQPGSTVVVVGDGAVGLMGVLAAKQMGAERIIAMSRHKARKNSPSNMVRLTLLPNVARQASPASRRERANAAECARSLAKVSTIPTSTVTNRARASCNVPVS